MNHRTRRILARTAMLACVACYPDAASGTDLDTRSGLRIESPAEPPTGENVFLSQPLGSKGPTSIRFLPLHADRKPRPCPNPADPPGSQYLVKDRDLGQTFTMPGQRPRLLEAITLRVGPAPYGGSIAGAQGAAAIVQILEVTGEPVIHDNGTAGETTVSVSYPKQALADDYMTGEKYRHIVALRGGRLPDKMRVAERNTIRPTNTAQSTLLRFDVSAANVRLVPGRRYAFLVGFEEPGEGRSLPIDNWDFLNQKDAKDRWLTGPYDGGHAIRREGRLENPQNDLRKALEQVDASDPTDSVWSAFPAELSARLLQQPGTWGRPDVDTYRDLAFWLEGPEAEKEPAR